MGQLWSFIKQEENRKILGWMGGGLAVAVAGLWTAVVYFSTSPQKPSIEASCGSIGIGGSVTGATITAGNTGNCPEKPQ
jgi:hypothetical protein